MLGRVRLVLRRGRARVPAARAAHGHRQLQSRDREHGLRRERPPVLRGALARDADRDRADRAARRASSSRWAARSPTRSPGRSSAPASRSSAPIRTTSTAPRTGTRSRSCSTAPASTSRAWTEARSLTDVLAFCARVGFPVLVRPSYVLSGLRDGDRGRSRRARRLPRARHRVLRARRPWSSAGSSRTRRRSSSTASRVGGEVVAMTMSEHVENAGVHSGDATIVVPPQRIFAETARRVRKIGRQIAKLLRITGVVQHPVRGARERRDGHRVQPAREPHAARSSAR